MVISVSFGFFWGASGGNYLVAKRHLCKHLGFLNPHVSFYRAYEIHNSGMQPSQTAQTFSQGNFCDRGRANFVSEQTLVGSSCPVRSSAGSHPQHRQVLQDLLKAKAIPIKAFSFLFVSPSA